VGGVGVVGEADIQRRLEVPPRPIARKTLSAEGAICEGFNRVEGNNLQGKLITSQKHQNNTKMA
jgi:hypothetical protein